MFDQIVVTMGWPFTIVYISMILGSFYFFFISIPKTIRTKGWPKVEGEILSSKLNKQKKTTKNGVVDTYSADIEYRYSLAGTEYLSKKIKLLDYNSTNKNPHQATIDRYPQGKKVEVFYNPNKPSISILEPGFGAGNIVGALFFTMGIASMTYLLSTKL